MVMFIGISWGSMVILLVIQGVSWSLVLRIFMVFMVSAIGIFLVSVEDLEVLMGCIVYCTHGSSW